MRQRRSNRTKQHLGNAFPSPNALRPAEQKPTVSAEREPNGETHRRLDLLFGEIKQLTEGIKQLTAKVEEIKETQVAHAAQNQQAQPEDWLSRLLHGKLNGVLGLSGNTIAVASVVASFVSICFGLLKHIPVPPQTALPWTLADFVKPLLPMAVIFSVTALIGLAAQRLEPKSKRLRFLRGLMVCYSLASAAYLAWLSLAFLRYNTLPGGALLMLTWGCIVWVLRRTSKEAGEMQQVIQDERKNEAEQPLVDG